MILNQKEGKIFCFHCNKWYDILTEVWLDFLYEGSITCLEKHLVGNTWDKDWIEYFKHDWDKGD